MILTRQILIQMAIFTLIATTALAIMVFGYMRLPAMLGVGEYRVTLELPETGGLYPRSNVTYRGVEVGIVDSVTLTDTGVAAVLSLKSDTKIPADVDAEVHSVSSVGEQFVQLIPRSGTGPDVEGRRRDPARPRHRPNGYQHGAGHDEPRSGGDPARQPEDGGRRGLYRGRRTRAGATQVGHRQHRRWPSTPARISTR